MLERIKVLEEKHKNQRNETTRLLALAKTNLETADLWRNVKDSEKEVNLFENTALLYLKKAESL